jgi:protein-disulfide isomerase
MASGKKSKERRRVAAAAPAVRSKGRPTRRQANPKVLAAVAGVVVLAAIGIGLALALGGSKSPAANSYPAVGTLTNALPGASDVNALFKGIPQSGFRLGAATAPVTMVEYIDLQCPFCQQFETQVLPDLVPRYVRSGKVKIELRVLDFIGPDSSRGRDALIAAASQNKAFNFAEILYDNQATENTGWLNDAMVGAAISSIPGIRVQQALSVRSAASVAKQAHTFDLQQAADLVTSTPTLLVGKSGTKGTEVSSPTDKQSVLRALDAALAS